MSKLAEGVERLLIIGGDVLGAALIVQPRVLRPNRRIIQSRRNRMGCRNLSRYVLQNKGISPLQYAGATSLPAEPCRMFSQRVAASSGFNANQLDFAVLDELIESANGVGTPANTGDYRGRKLPFCLQDLSARLFADDAVEVAHHRGIRMRAQHTTQ